MEAAASNAPTIRLGDIGADFRGRSHARSRLSCRTLLNVPGGGIVRGHTVSVGEQSLILTVPSLLAVGQECGVFFAVSIADETFTIVGTGRVERCSGNGQRGHQVEMRLTVEDKRSRIAMEQLFGGGRSNRI